MILVTGIVCYNRRTTFVEGDARPIIIVTGVVGYSRKTRRIRHDTRRKKCDARIMIAVTDIVGYSRRRRILKVHTTIITNANIFGNS